MGKFFDLWQSVAKTKNDIKTQERVIDTNTSIFDQVSKSFQTIEAFEVFTTDWEAMNSFTEDDENLNAVYKQWEITIGVISDTDFLISSIIANTSYQILYRDSIESDFNYYSVGTELKSTDFWEYRDGVLYLNVSTYIKKNFEVTEFFPPEVKLNIIFRNLNSISQ